MFVVTQQNLVESQFIRSVVDNLNAEVMIVLWGVGGGNVCCDSAEPR